MVKPKPQASRPVNPESVSTDTGHPLLRPTQLDKFTAAAQKRAQAKEFQIEELGQWRDSLNRIAASPDGQLLLRSMIQFSELHSPPADYKDTVKMVVDRSRQAFYLTWVRPYLDPQLRKEIE